MVSDTERTSGEGEGDAGAKSNLGGSAHAPSSGALPEARSAAIAAVGVTTGTEFAALMSALMSDVIEGRLSPVVSNAAVSAGRNLLKVVEMEYKYGLRGEQQQPQRPTLQLAGE